MPTRPELAGDLGERPFHPYGLSHSEYLRESALELGLEFDTSPSWAEVLDARRDRQRA